MRAILPAIVVAPLLAAVHSPPARATSLDESMAGRFAGLALACVHREYPNKIAHVLGADSDAQPPRTLTPVFFGCYDWHSSVHGHWLLVRLVRLYPDAGFAAHARAALAASFTTDRVAQELAYLQGPGRVFIRAALRACLAPAARGRIAGVGRRGCAPLGRDPASAGNRGGGANPRVAAEASLSDPRGRTRADRFCIRPDSRLVSRGRRRRDAGADR